ncbi:hypothetical protein [Streptomyces smyrnaeus]|uniref:Acyl-CoA dehydrogenase n=1 Tax=Streptomyces smyrnaeus TaxID=1387713 RepID=A0ABS3Y694_9ACTN|nr:hypothetical protein [Streptomyces smyrnaeus]MBO8203188.1 hypothetical protein [Streptomyces smyrnaeus]
MSAQPEYPVDPRVRPIPCTIDAVASALTGANRMAFFAEVGSAERGQQLDDALRKWWMEALFEAQPGRTRRLADVAAGHRLVALPDEVGEG